MLFSQEGRSDEIRRQGAQWTSSLREASRTEGGGNRLTKVSKESFQCNSGNGRDNPGSFVFEKKQYKAANK